MIKVTFEHFSKILNKSYTNVKCCKKIEDFNLYALALFHGQVKIISIETLVEIFPEQFVEVLPCIE